MTGKVRKAVFPAAGLGTRFLPATKAMPKEMLPLVDKPLIQYAVEEALDSGVENIIIVTGRGKSAIEDYFDKSFELQHELEAKGKTEELELIERIANLARVSYIRQKEPLGLGHAVGVTRELVGDEPFAVILADDLIRAETPCLRQLIDIYERFSASVIAVMEVPIENISAYGVVDVVPVRGGEGRLFEVKNMVEKPPADQAPSNLAIIGRYVLTPNIFEALDETERGSGGEIQLTDAIKKLISRDKVYAYRFEGDRFDAGDKLGFLQATVEFALKREDLGPPLRKFLKQLDLG